MARQNAKFWFCWASIHRASRSRFLKNSIYIYKKAALPSESWRLKPHQFCFQNDCGGFHQQERRATTQRELTGADSTTCLSVGNKKKKDGCGLQEKVHWSSKDTSQCTIPRDILSLSFRHAQTFTSILFYSYWSSTCLNTNLRCVSPPFSSWTTGKQGGIIPY